MADAIQSSEVSTLLSDLTSLSKTLNTESDSINALIKQFQATLTGLNLGLEVWVTVSEKFEDLSTEDSDEPHERIEGSRDLELGFAKSYPADWALCLREVLYRLKPEDYQYRGYWEQVSIEHEKELLQCSRQERINALERFPALLRELKAEAERAVKAIQNAKTFVAQC